MTTLNVKAVSPDGTPTASGNGTPSDKVYKDKDEKQTGKFKFMIVDTSKEVKETRTPFY